MFRISAILVIISLITVSSCVSPQGDYYEDVLYGEIYPQFTLALVNSNGTSLQKSNFGMGIKLFVNHNQNLLLINEERLQLLALDSMRLLQSREVNFSRLWEADVTSDGSQVVLSAVDADAGCDLFLIDPVDLSITNLTHSRFAPDRYPNFTKDNQHIVFNGFDMGVAQFLIVYDLSTARFDTLTSKKDELSQFNGYFPAFTYPHLDLQDSVIYYYYSGAYNNRLNGIRVFVSPEKKDSLLLELIYLWGPLYISQNSQWALFAGGGKPYYLTLFNLKTEQSQPIAEMDIYHMDYALAPQGDNIAYVQVTKQDTLGGKRCNPYDAFNVWLINPDGSNKTLIGHGRWPTFSQDGQKIAFYQASYTVY